MKLISSTFALMLILTGCAKINDAGMKFLSSSSPAFMVINGQFLTGDAVLYIDRSGTLALESTLEPKIKCMGSIRYTATRSGTANIRCSDGVESAMTFNAITETRGFGGGATGVGTASFAFGMTADEASAYLSLPVGKRIATSPTGEIQLVSN